MKGDLVRPLLVPRPPHRPSESVAPRATRLGLTVAELPLTRTAGAVYGMASMDCRGRVADRFVLKAMAWKPGRRLEIRAVQGLLVVRALADGVFAITGQGHLRLSASVRRWCGLVAGDRVFLAGDPVKGQLVVHPPAALDAMIARSHAGLLDGGVN